MLLLLLSVTEVVTRLHLQLFVTNHTLCTLLYIRLGDSLA